MRSTSSAKQSFSSRLVIGTDIWKGFGYNTVVYLAAILGVDKSLYEAAAVDGCGRFKRIWHVTLPGIKQQ